MKRKFFSFQTTAIILGIVAIAIITATIIESFTGVNNAWKYVYKSAWFEVLLAVLVLNLFGSMFYYSSFSWRKISVPIFHISFILIILGAFFTRYTGFEGTMHIREGERSNLIYFNDGTIKNLPFDIYLHDFSIDYYPGSDSPSSFSSFVKVYEKSGDAVVDYHIYMNHVLKYKGWRFFQTSFDEDRKGTILTASCDVLGTALTYAGYFTAIAFMLISLFMPGSFFRNQIKLLKKISVATIFFLLSFQSFGQEIDYTKVVPEIQARKFGELIVQDNKGRMKVMNTLNREFMSKIYGEDKIKDLNADRVVLSILTFPEYWEKFPLMEIKNEEVRKIFGVETSRVSYLQLFDNNYEFLVSPYVDEVFSKPLSERNKNDKAILEANDDANILDMFLSRRALKIFPVAGALNNTWYSVEDAYEKTDDYNDSFFLKNIFDLYRRELISYPETKDLKQADLYLSSIKTYQMNLGKEIYPSNKQIVAELLYNKLNLFDKLQYWLALLGISMTVIYVVSLLKGININKWIFLSFRLLALIFLIIIFAGITLRWIAGGYFPLSNSYEVMLFISGFSILVGLIYSKKQPLLLSLSMILSFSFLLVAHLMNINPAIGNLVPVLKSYWLSIHVAIITSSYAIFGLVMLISLVNLSLFLFVKERDYERITLHIRDLGIFNNILLIIGLYMLVTGTIFGAVWANESWGRYWGWDPKESWALISILIYAFVSHMRLIPAFKNDYITNLASFWAFASILMTFFGVNYLMAGIHSYAGTGSSEIPVWVLILTAILVIYTSLSGIRYFKISSK